MASGDDIPIEERSEDEVLDLEKSGMIVSPEGVSARNPAFDITPNRLVTGIITENGVCYPPFRESLFEALHAR
jgi:methylthioribose-1-phosphate isomerase